MSELDDLIKEFTKELQGNDDLSNAVTTINEEEILAAKELRKELSSDDIKELKSVVNDSATWGALPSKAKSKISKIKNLVPDLFDDKSSISGNNAMVANQQLSVSDKVTKNPLGQATNEKINAGQRLNFIMGDDKAAQKIEKDVNAKNRWGQLWTTLATPMRMEYAGAKTYIDLLNKYNLGQDNPVEALNKIYDLPLHKAAPGKPLTAQQMAENRKMTEEYLATIPEADLQFKENKVPKGELLKAMLPALKDAFLNKEGSGFEDKYLGDLLKEKELYRDPKLYEELNKKFPKVQEVLDAPIDETNFWTKYLGWGQESDSQGVLAKMGASLLGSPADILGLGVNIAGDPLSYFGGAGTMNKLKAGIGEAGAAVAASKIGQFYSKGYPGMAVAARKAASGFKIAGQAFSLAEKTPLQKIFNKADRERIWEMTKFADHFSDVVKKANLTQAEAKELSYLMEKPWEIQDVVRDVTTQQPIKKMIYDNAVDIQMSKTEYQAYKELNDLITQNQSAFEKYIETFRKKYRGELEETISMVNSGSWNLNKAGNKRWVTNPEGIGKTEITELIHGRGGYGGLTGKWAKEYGAPKELLYNASDKAMGLKGLDDSNINEFLEMLAESSTGMKAGQNTAKELTSLKDITTPQEFIEYYSKFNANKFNKTFAEDVIMEGRKMGYLDELGDLNADNVLTKELADSLEVEYGKYAKRADEFANAHPEMSVDDIEKVFPFVPDADSLYGLYMKRQQLLSARDVLVSKVDLTMLEDKLKTLFKGDWYATDGSIKPKGKAKGTNFADEPKQLQINKEGIIVDDLGKEVKTVYVIADNEEAVRKIFSSKKLGDTSTTSKRFVTLYSNMDDAAKAANGRIVMQVGVPKSWRYGAVNGTMADKIGLGSSIYLPGESIFPTNMKVFETMADDVTGKLMVREFDLDKSGTISYFKKGNEITEYVSKIKQIKERIQVPKELKPNMQYAKDEMTKIFDEFLQRDLDLGLLGKDTTKAQKAMAVWEAKQRGYVPGRITKEFWQGITPTEAGAAGAIGKVEQAFQKPKTLTLGQRKALFGDATEENIFKLAIMRADEQFKAEMYATLLPQVKNYGKTFDELTAIEKQFWVEPKLGFKGKGGTLSGFEGIYFSPEDANILTKFTGFRTDEATKLFIKAFDQTMHIMKGYMTVANAGFHMRNMYSNYWMLFLKDGMKAFDPGSNLDSWKVVIYDKARKTKLGQKLGAEAVEYGGKKFTIAELWEESGKTTVRRSGYIRSDAGESLMQRLDWITQSKANRYASRINPMSGENAIIKTGDFVGGIIEDQARVTGWINDLKKGALPEVAAENTKFYMIDYSDLSSMEKNINRRFIPFYSWLRKNMELEIKSLFEQPGKFNIMPKIKKYIESLSPADLPGERAEYMKEGDYIKFPWKSSWFTGNPEDENRYLYLNPNAPWQDLYKATDTESISAVVNPMFKVPAEAIFNRELFFKRDIEATGKGKDDITQLPVLFQKAFQAMPDDVFDKITNLPVINKLNIGKSPTTGEIYGRKRLEYFLRQQPFINNISKVMNDYQTTAQDKGVKKWLDRLSAILGIKFNQGNPEANKKVYLDNLTNMFNAKVGSQGILNLPAGQKYPSATEINAILTDLAEESLGTRAAYDKAEELKAITKFTGSNWAVDYIINQMKEPYSEEKENLKEKNMKELFAILKANGMTEEPTIEEVIKALQTPAQ